MRSRTRAVAVAAFALFGLAAAAAIAADSPYSRTELAKRGKPATAMVLVEPGGVSGTAFIVRPDGWLVTNAHVVAAASRPGGSVRVALRPGEPDQKVLVARLIRADKDKDLAALRVDGEKDLPALPLGDSDRLTELTDLVGFGFPFGTQLAPTRTELPAVTVTVSSVTSLRRRGGALAEIQLDGALNPGHSGGPLLAADGTVVGVIRSGIRGAQIAQAIPANVVKAFLAAPDISFSPPKLSRADLGQPAEFRANVVPLLPGAAPPAVELILDTGDGRPRKVPMALRDGAYRAMAVPVPRSGPVAVGVTARYGPVTIAGPVADRDFTVGGKGLKLSQVRRLEPSGTGKAVTHDGETLAGSVAGLDGVELRLTSQAIQIDLARADAVEVVPPAGPARLTCMVVATADGKEVGRAIAVIPQPGATGGTAAVTQPAGPAVAVAPAALEADRMVRRLPDTFSDVCAGAGGRYLLFGLPKQGKVAVFDVSQARIVHYFPAPDPGAKFAAGADKVVIALPGPHLLQRWSLVTFERELSVLFPTQEPIFSVLLGHASHGPVVANGKFLDLKTFKPMDVKGPDRKPAMPIPIDPRTSVISANGTVVSTVSYGIYTSILMGDVVQTYGNLGGSTSYVAPSADGRLVFSPLGVYTNDMKPVSAANGQQMVRFVPAVQGTMYLGLRQANPTPQSRVQEGPLPIEVALYVPGESRPLVQLGPIAGDLFGSAPGDPLPLNKRVWFIPEAKVLVTVPPLQDVVYLTPFDLDQALEKSGTDFLFVVSDPPVVARRGDRYAHQLVVKSKRGEVRCKLDSGPDGMTVTAAGLVEWQAPANFASDTTTVIVSVSDASGQEVFKSFTIKVGR